MPIDASRIHGGLYQGGAPPKGRALSKAGFDVVVLCAEEYQPDDHLFPGVSVVRLPMADIPVLLTEKQLRMLKLTAREVAFRLERGQKVLVTCAAGLNRSGLLNAAILIEAYGASPVQAIRTVRLHRNALALNNPAFVHAIVTQLRRPRRS